MAVLSCETQGRILAVTTAIVEKVTDVVSTKDINQAAMLFLERFEPVATGSERTTGVCRNPAMAFADFFEVSISSSLRAPMMPFLCQDLANPPRFSCSFNNTTGGRIDHCCNATGLRIKIFFARKLPQIDFRLRD